jgi:hypothetical protein
MNNYARYVKEMYWPAVPERSESGKENIRNPIKTAYDVEQK